MEYLRGMLGTNGGYNVNIQDIHTMAQTQARNHLHILVLEV